MGSQRNGARTLLDLMAKACKLSRLPGFRQGIFSILGNDTGAEFLGFWDPLCAYVDSLIALDNYFNRKDSSDEGESEDGVPVG